MYKILDLFCGAGGFSYGLEQNKLFKTLIGLDIEKSAVETFEHNFPEAVGVCADITDKKTKENLIKLANKLEINMIIGGPPCQGFSLKGKNLGLKDPRNFLFLEYLELVEALKPELFIIENVKNLYSSANGYFKNEIIKKIEELGYLVNCDILNAKDYQVPQNRQRVFFIAHKSKFLKFPEKIDKKISVKDAISDLAYLESSQGEIYAEYKNEPKSEYQKSLRGKILQYHKSSNHSKIAIEKLKLIPPECGKEYLPSSLKGKQKFSTTWARLVWDEISPTIDTRFDTPSNGKNSHPTLNRAITPREAARLQSFSDDFIFKGTKTQVCKQIGNAVPPFLAKNIANAIQMSLKIQKQIGQNYQIFNADSFLIIEEFIKKQIIVNHIITDPPYNISVSNNFQTLKNANRKGIDFGNWDKDFSFEWIGKFAKILDKNGSFVVFCSYKFISDIVKEFEKNDIVVKDILVWQKSNPMPRNTKRRYVQDMEFAIWGVKKGANWIFNPLSKNYQRAFFTSSIVSGKEKTSHPTQKSLKVMKDIIKIHTNKNDIILDPFMGSGTTGVASLELDRRFMGIELDCEYYKISQNRIKIF